MLRYNSIAERFEHPIFGCVDKKDIISSVHTINKNNAKIHVANVWRKYSLSLGVIEKWPDYVLKRKIYGAKLLMCSEYLDPLYISCRINKIHVTDSLIKLFIDEGMQSLVVKMLCMAGFDITRQSFLRTYLTCKPTPMSSFCKDNTYLMGLIQERGVVNNIDNLSSFFDRLVDIRDKMEEITYLNWEELFTYVFYYLGFKPSKVRTSNKFSCTKSLQYHNLINLHQFIPEDSSCTRSEDGIHLKVCSNCKCYAMLSELYFKFLREVSLFTLLSLQRSHEEDELDEIEKLLGL